jgi:GT2 family glycosyltransferase
MTSAPETDRANAGLGPVSVVICNYNGADHLPPCLAALAQLEGVVDEWILVDNQSTDASLEVVAEHAPHIRVIDAGSNDGPARARNLGFAAAKNRWVLSIDNDAVLEPDVLVKLAAAVAANPGTTIAQPRSVFEHEPDRVHYDGGSFHAAGLITLRNFYVPRVEAVGEGVVDVDCAIAVALLIDRERLAELGNYDERYFILFEDLDLSYRLRARGDRILSVEDAICHHRAGTPGVSFREGPNYPGSRVFYHSRNRWMFLAKNYRARTLFFATPLLVCYELVWLLFAAAGGNADEWLRGKRDFFIGWPETSRLRAAAQSTRTVADRDLLIGGPLTTTPALGKTAFHRALLTALSGTLRLLWLLARPFV